MQLTSIDQCKCFMPVWHPIYGKGEIDEVSTHLIYVVFEGNTGWALCFLSDNYKFSLKSHSQGFISHLYTEPVYICEKVTGSTATEVFGTIYKPISKEQ